uniref:Uncharacterized protein n=1 Tax=Arundo donax TaxID=35708 RepID=A0A0A9E716_ARUDO
MYAMTRLDQLTQAIEGSPLMQATLSGRQHVSTSIFLSAPRIYSYQVLYQ